MAGFEAFSTYVHVRSFAWRNRSRSSLKQWQEARVRHWLKNDVPQVAAFVGQAKDLSDLPVMDKADLMADFSRYNVAGITNDQGWVAFDGNKQIGDYIVGASTGTSGNRGLFVISQKERFTWLGAILAKALPDFWRHKDRIAVLLPLNTPLYDSANRTRRLELRFFDLNRPFEDVAGDLKTFAPTVIIAPPRILRRCQGLGLSPRKIFTAAETCDPFDRTAIEAGFGMPLAEIYMATEGLLGTTCHHGQLHLAEDCLHFEFEPVGDGLVMPIISDFSRKTQIMARYRMNDLLRLSPQPCACGSPLQVVAEIVGRQDDIFVLKGQSGQKIEITPDILRNTILDTDRRIEDYRLVQVSEDQIELQLPAHLCLEVKNAVMERLNALFAIQGVGQTPHMTLQTLKPEKGGKLRRIKRVFTLTAAQTGKTT